MCCPSQHILMMNSFIRFFNLCVSAPLQYFLRDPSHDCTVPHTVAVDQAIWNALRNVVLFIVNAKILLIVLIRTFNIAFPLS